MLPKLRDIENLGVMTMKGYPTLLRPSELEPHYQMQFSVIHRTPFSLLVGVFRLHRGYSQFILSSHLRQIGKSTNIII